MTREDKEKLKIADQLPDEDLGVAVGVAQDSAPVYKINCGQCDWSFTSTDYQAFISAVNAHQNTTGHAVI